MAAAHHERLDGSGYHLHLREGELPLGAPILAVADVYEALTADRPYREGMASGDALKIVRGEAGSRLAAAPVAALAKMVRHSEPGFA